MGPHDGRCAHLFYGAGLAASNAQHRRGGSPGRRRVRYLDARDGRGEQPGRAQAGAPGVVDYRPAAWLSDLLQHRRRHLFYSAKFRGRHDWRGRSTDVFGQAQPAERPAFCGCRRRRASTGRISRTASSLNVERFYKQRRSTRIVLFNFWEYVAFVANSLVFLLIGLQVNMPDLLADWRAVWWAILGVLLARVLVVYGFTWLANRVTHHVPLLWQHALAWGGMRGALSLALALTLPLEFGAERERLRVMTLGVVLFTLLAQGATTGPLLRRLHIATRPRPHTE
ncbi:MAG: hypothetical protein E6J26_05755 [Chloroflexi bacterium]|nr:MAG: hypothetical protein E6J26_05755 [Chloroflexota bacterium]